MQAAVTDTHGMIWYLANSARLGANASRLFDACDQGQITLFIPSICLVEMIFLQEKGRIPLELKKRFDVELQNGRSGFVVMPLTEEIANAVARISREAVPEMPDRIIAATALHLNVPLISYDLALQKAGLPIIW